MIFTNLAETEKTLEALSSQMEAMGLPSVELLVCGGAALNILGFIDRATKDIDVVASIEHDAKGNATTRKGSDALSRIKPAIAKVARDFDLPENWMNSTPESVLDFGLPEGLLQRTTTKSYGSKLTIRFLGRFDQICFKFYAAADQGPGRHYDDLLKLNPTPEEIEQAARWSMTHDPSEGYRISVKGLIEVLGHHDVAERI